MAALPTLLSHHPLTQDAVTEVSGLLRSFMRLRASEMQRRSPNVSVWHWLVDKLDEELLELQVEVDHRPVDVGKLIHEYGDVIGTLLLLQAIRTDDATTRTPVLDDRTPRAVTLLNEAQRLVWLHLGVRLTPLTALLAWSDRQTIRGRTHRHLDNFLADRFGCRGSYVYQELETLVSDVVRACHRRAKGGSEMDVMVSTYTLLHIIGDDILHVDASTDEGSAS
jgi:hypothetical protein